MNVNVPYLLTVLGVVLVSMTVHEAMHAYVSNYLGDETAKLQGRLTLNPLKHLDPFLSIILPLLLALTGGPIFGAAKPVPLNPNKVRGGEWGFALVALAGPLTNFVLAFISFGLLVLIGGTNSTFGNVLFTACYVNLGFFVFNLIPIPPLDGSRLLYALAPDFFKRFMEGMERFGILIIFGLIFLVPDVFSVLISGTITFFLTAFSRLFGV